MAHIICPPLVFFLKFWWRLLAVLPLGCSGRWCGSHTNFHTNLARHLVVRTCCGTYDLLCWLSKPLGTRVLLVVAGCAINRCAGGATAVARCVAWFVVCGCLLWIVSHYRLVKHDPLQVSYMCVGYEDYISHAICCPVCFPSNYDGDYSHLSAGRFALGLFGLLNTVTWYSGHTCFWGCDKWSSRRGSTLGLRTALPFRRQTQKLSGLSPKRDCGPKRVRMVATRGYCIN